MPSDSVSEEGEQVTGKGGEREKREAPCESSFCQLSARVEISLRTARSPSLLQETDPKPFSKATRYPSTVTVPSSTTRTTADPPLPLRSSPFNLKSSTLKPTQFYMNQPNTDSYWSYEGAGDDMDTTPGAGGYSPAAGVMGQDASSSSTTSGNYGRPLAKTASEDLRQSYGGTQGGNGSQNNTNGGEYGGFNPMANTRLSPSAFDPNSFSGQFILPRFATGGQNDPFGMGVGVMHTSR